MSVAFAGNSFQVWNKDVLLQAPHAYSLLPIRELKMADGDGAHMLTGCDGVSQ